VQPVDGGQVSPMMVRRLRSGDTVKLGAPVGDQLVLPQQENGERDLLMVAGGTGLAPLRAVVEQIDRTWQTTGAVPRVHLFHGARMPWNLYDHVYLSRLTERPWFDYTPVVSDDPSYPSERGLVGAVAARFGPWDDRTVMVCGSPRMVKHTVAEFEGAGIPSTSLRVEQFIFGYQVGSPREVAGRDDRDEDNS
jgi:NAD(P)H-flavin reductase